ncbi:MAG: thermonuclease family protein [Acidimicrobiales bacterium]
MALVCLVGLAACGRAHTTTAQRAGPPAGGGGNAATIVRVVDGDTVIVSLSGRQERVRLIGVDTPESVKPNTPVQCFALEASARTKALLPPGTGVLLERDADLRDRYKRLLAYIYRSSDGLFVNLVLAREGYALPYTFPPNVAHADEFVAAAGEARAAHRGLWSRCRDPSAPLEAAHGTG